MENQITLLDEVDEYSRKRISLHKVQRHNPDKPEDITHSYHMVIIDVSMTINVELSEASIINLLNAMKK